MKAILVGMGETMTDEEAEDLIKEASIDDDGYVDEEDRHAHNIKK